MQRCCHSTFHSAIGSTVKSGAWTPLNVSLEHFFLTVYEATRSYKATPTGVPVSGPLPAWNAGIAAFPPYMQWNTA